MHNPEKAKQAVQYFCAYSGGYAEGDIFLGISVPEKRKIAKQNWDISLKETKKLLKSPVHDCRFVGLIILVLKWQNGDEDQKSKISQFYFDNMYAVDNWDLVDSTAPQLIGEQIWTEHNPLLMYELLKHDNIWHKRIAVLASWAFIKKGEFKHTLLLSESLFYHPHHLLHKACGWMLREVGKKDEKTLSEWLNKNAHLMPRTMLRYSIEKYPANKRKHWMQQKD